jgi:uncharacterized protein
MLDLKPILQAILKEYPLSKFGVHGLAHWARVWENGLRLAEATGANTEVVRLFAVFHDCQRVTEESDPTHGLRGARFAADLRGKLFDLSDDDFDLLFVSCAGHMDHPIDDDPTVQTCWDADRLDLGRVGTTISPAWLGETTTGNPTLIDWADRRASMQTVPEIIRKEWGIRTQCHRKTPEAKTGRKAR